MLDALGALPDRSLYLTETPFRGRTLDQYGAWRSRAAGAWSDPGRALAEMLERARPGDRAIVTGSLYLVGEILKGVCRAPENQVAGTDLT